MGKIQVIEIEMRYNGLTFKKQIATNRGDNYDPQKDVQSLSKNATTLMREFADNCDALATEKELNHA